MYNTRRDWRRSSMAEQGTHKPLVPSSNLGVATEGLALPEGVHMVTTQPRIVTPVSWLVAPAWLTVDEACQLSGRDRDTMLWMIEDGSVDAKLEGDAYLVEKASLHEFLELLVELSHWND